MPFHETIHVSIAHEVEGNTKCLLILLNASSVYFQKPKKLNRSHEKCIQMIKSINIHYQQRALSIDITRNNTTYFLSSNSS
jgi:hypothetical protein